MATLASQAMVVHLVHAMIMVLLLMCATNRLADALVDLTLKGTTVTCVPVATLTFRPPALNVVVTLMGQLAVVFHVMKRVDSVIAKQTLREGPVILACLDLQYFQPQTQLAVMCVTALNLVPTELVLSVIL